MEPANYFLCLEDKVQIPNEACEASGIWSLIPFHVIHVQGSSGMEAAIPWLEMIPLSLALIAPHANFQCGMEDITAPSWQFAFPYMLHGSSVLRAEPAGQEVLITLLLSDSGVN